MTLEKQLNVAIHKAIRKALTKSAQNLVRSTKARYVRNLN